MIDSQQPLASRLHHEMTLLRFAFHILPPFKSSATVAQHVSMVRSNHRLITGVDIADGNKMPRLTACPEILTYLFPVKRRQRFAITTNFFRHWRASITWYVEQFSE